MSCITSASVAFGCKQILNGEKTKERAANGGATTQAASHEDVHTSETVIMGHHFGTNQSLLRNHRRDFRHELRELPAQAFLNSCADGEEWTAATQEVWLDGSAQLQMQTLHIPLLSVIRN